MPEGASPLLDTEISIQGATEHGCELHLSRRFLLRLWVSLCLFQWLWATELSLGLEFQTVHLGRLRDFCLKTTLTSWCRNFILLEFGRLCRMVLVRTTGLPLASDCSCVRGVVDSDNYRIIVTRVYLRKSLLLVRGDGGLVPQFGERPWCLKAPRENASSAHQVVCYDSSGVLP